jgi:hypothetical protein
MRTLNQKTTLPPHGKTTSLISFRGINAVYYENYLKYVNTIDGGKC